MSRKTCHYCPAPATTRDHIVPRAWGGKNRHWNVVPACFACNQAKGQFMPTCGCQHCTAALRKWMRGDRNPIVRAVRPRVTRGRGIWHVMVPQPVGRARRYTFRTLRRAHEFATRRCTPF